MILNSIILAMSSSIDSLGIGITYGLKHTKITCAANIILFAISLVIATFSMFLGNYIHSFFSDIITNILGSIIIISMGIFITFQAFNKKNNNIYNTHIKDKKIYSFFVRFLGITIQIIKDPLCSDLDNSKKIDSNEAFFLGFALSLDSFCIGTGSSIAGITNYLFPILISLFQLIFLKLGNVFGKKLTDLKKFPDNTWSILSGLLLILIGFIKLI